jgi:hypothetical protein
MMAYLKAETCSCFWFLYIRYLLRLSDSYWLSGNVLFCNQLDR